MQEMDGLFAAGLQFVDEPSVTVPAVVHRTIVPLT